MSTQAPCEPWTRHNSTYGERRGIVIRNVTGIVAFIPQDAGRDFAAFDVERAKCADLMFAAPELLEALDTVASWMESFSKLHPDVLETEFGEDLKTARAAIARATGGK